MNHTYKYAKMDAQISMWLQDETDNPSYLYQGSKADLIQELKT